MAVLFAFTAKAQSRITESQNSFIGNAGKKMRTGDYKGALADCNSAIEENSSIHSNYIVRGSVNTQLRQYADALADFKRALALAEQNTTNKEFEYIKVTIFIGMGQVHDKQGNYEQAIEYYDKALVIKPDFAYALKRKAELEMKLNRYQAALYDLDKALQINSNDVSTLISRSIVLDHLNRFDESIENNLWALQLQPQNTVLYNNLGFAKVKMGQYQQATQFLYKAMEISDRNGMAMTNLGVIQFWQGNYEEAINLYSKAIELKATNAQGERAGYIARGLAKAKAGKLTDALSDYQQAIKSSPAHAYNYLCLGELKLAMADYTSAVDALTKSIVLDSADARAHNSLGYAYFRLNDYKNALKFYDLAVTKGGAGYQPYYQYRTEAAPTKQGSIAFNHLEWICPVEDVNKMFKSRYYAPTDSVTIRVKIYADKPIIKAQIKCLLNNKSLTAKQFIGKPQITEAVLNKITSQYECEYKARIKVAEGNNTIRIQYQQKNLPELTVRYEPQI
jgi:tetratricopeptide (TPR) repeat protein